LAIEAAEASAEALHLRVRRELWGYAPEERLTNEDLIAEVYRGIRPAAGYPACPDLEDQAGIWKLLKPEEIGVELTEGFMMDPEASVSALAFIHPDCSYFSVGEE
jgi:5-methyltetrahydrofolate--homocysteine methyltransferase